MLDDLYLLLCSTSRKLLRELFPEERDATAASKLTFVPR